MDKSAAADASDMRDLVDTLRFSPGLGRIWRDDVRCGLMTEQTLGDLREQVIAAAGWEAARRIFWTIGYAEGSRCVRTARAVRPGDHYLQAFLVGPQVHAVNGFGWVDVEALDETPERRFEGRFRVHDSFEAHAHIDRFGIGADPICWFQTGFASGFASRFAGRQIIMRETECMGMGDTHCVLHATLVDAEIEAEVANGQPVADLDPDEPIPEDGILGQSPRFIGARRLLEKTADSTATLLLQGETGVGKEVFARLAHRLSRRRDAPFIALNCAAIPEGLIESELFGVARGAYTGASVARPGRFERAHGGTLFLDEISSLSPLAQSKVLRAIQEREIERVGETRTTAVDVRLIAASNVDLMRAVKEGAFRTDLYYRVSTCPITIPPLRERREDIPRLIGYFRQRFNKAHQCDVRGMTARALDLLMMYDFPGNIRELERLVERAVLLCEPGQPIDLRHLFPSGEYPAVRQAMHVDVAGRVSDVPPPQTEPPGIEQMAQEALSMIKAGNACMESLERTIMAAAVAQAGGNLARAARDLGISRRQLAGRIGRALDRSAPPRQQAPEI